MFRDIFDFDWWQSSGVLHSYHDVTLKKSIKAFNVGDKFDKALFNLAIGVLLFFRQGEVVLEMEVEVSLMEYPYVPDSR